VKRFASFDGVGIAYDVLGAGPAVLMHHGFASSSATNWVRPGVAAAVAGAGYSVILIDARGHGESDKPHEPAAYADGAMVRDVRELLDVLGLDSVNVVGYSMGAYVAMSLAPVEPRVRSLVLGGAGLNQTIRRPEYMTRIADALEATDPVTITDATARAFRNFADATGSDRLALAAVRRGDGPPQTLESLRSIAVPTLVVNGEEDALVNGTKSLADVIPNARLVSVPGNHLSAVVKLEFRQAIVTFLDGL
jgi:pimeloyl-ACP methyl ester carboxylesterase